MKTCFQNFPRVSSHTFFHLPFFPCTFPQSTGVEICQHHSSRTYRQKHLNDSFQAWVPLFSLWEIKNSRFKSYLRTGLGTSSMKRLGISLDTKITKPKYFQLGNVEVPSLVIWTEIGILLRQKACLPKQTKLCPIDKNSVFLGKCGPEQWKFMVLG